MNCMIAWNTSWLLPKRKFRAVAVDFSSALMIVQFLQSPVFCCTLRLDWRGYEALWPAWNWSSSHELCSRDSSSRWDQRNVRANLEIPSRIPQQKAQLCNVLKNRVKKEVSATGFFIYSLLERAFDKSWVMLCRQLVYCKRRQIKA